MLLFLFFLVEGIAYIAGYDEDFIIFYNLTTSSKINSRRLNSKHMRDITVLNDVLIFVDKVNGVQGISKQDGTEVTIETTGLEDCTANFYSVHAITSTFYKTL